MKDIYEAIRSLNPNCDNRILTVTEGPFIGEKMLLSNGIPVIPPDAAGFFAAHPELQKNPPEGLAAVGETKIYAEHISGSKKVIICGAGHVGIAVASIAKMIGCAVTVIDDRMVFTERAKELGVNVICDAFVNALQQISGDDNTYFVIVTRGHKWDKVCLREIAAKPHAYIGLMGSRRRVKIVMQDLVEEGISSEVLDNVHTPIGLKIGAETPEEIAVSVLAEIIQVKNAHQLKGGFSDEILEGILGHHDDAPGSEERILMTIISRKGSAPREAGTKMVLMEDGYTTAGTIGGGCVEADTVVRARRMLQDPDLKTELFHVNMTADAAEEEGMVCGGTVDILLEKI